jgi:nucleoside 2-deoxyribosyltransferase
MSHTLRKMQRPDNEHLRRITSAELPTFWRNERLPTPQKLEDNLILWIGDNQETPFRSASIDRSAIAALIGLPISLPADTDGWVWLNNQLDVKSLYQLGEVRQGRILDLKLSMYGWEKYEQLKHTAIASRTAFMAMKFNQSDVNHAVENCFRPAVGRTGFELRVLTHGQPAGSIDDQLRAGIVASRFVIADLTHGSPGAYWEAGFGEGLGRPVIYTCKKAAWEEQGTHFDTNHLTHIIWDPDDLKKAQDRLTATIRATFRADAKQTDDDEPVPEHR